MRFMTRVVIVHDTASTASLMALAAVNGATSCAPLDPQLPFGAPSFFGHKQLPPLLPLLLLWHLQWRPALHLIVIRLERQWLKYGRSLPGRPSQRAKEAHWHSIGFNFFFFAGRFLHSLRIWMLLITIDGERTAIVESRDQQGPFLLFFWLALSRASPNHRSTHIFSSLGGQEDLPMMMMMGQHIQ
jgi:hypothetical protein